MTLTSVVAAPRRSTPWLVLLGAVLLGAALQAASAVPGLGTAGTAWFALQAIGSLVVLVVEVAVLAWAARAVVHRERLGRLTVPLVAWSALVVVVAAAVAVLVPLAVPLALVVAACVLVEAAAGEPKAFLGLRVFRRTPVRAVLAALALVVIATLSWVVALLAGFFLTGALGSAVTWLWFGVIAALLLVWWTRIAARPGRESTQVPVATAATP